MRTTQQKKAILDAVKATKCLISAEEVFGEVRTKHPSVSLGTVYRNLQTFTDLGLLSKVLLADGKARFEWAQEHGAHHHHLICIGCGGATEVPWCPVGPEMRAFMENCRFTPVKHQFEVYGHCAGCKEKGSTPGT